MTGTAEATAFKFGVQIYYEDYVKNATLRTKGQWPRSRELFFNFWSLSISVKWQKL